MVKINAIIMVIITFFATLFGLKIKVTVTDKQVTTFNGWGTSAAWWAQMIDDDEEREYLAKQLFSKEGLGLNIYRYNVGGGIDPKTNRIKEKSRQTESFYYYNKETKKFEYDFTRDANAQKMLDEALKYGCIDTVVLFANSPHYSMTINGETSGSKDGGVSNMSPDKYQDFVDYFLTITEYFIEKGVPVKYISPINEPQWDWGGDYAGQEGCHYEPEQIVELNELFAKGIKDRNIDVKLMTPESGSIGKTTRNYFNSLKKSSASDVIGAYAYHSYWCDDKVEDKLNMGNFVDTYYRNTVVDMSEWCELPCTHDCDDTDAAVLMARIMANDIAMSHCNSWTNWVAVNLTNFADDGNKYSDGLFYSLDKDYNKVKPTTRFLAMEHFTKFVPAGSKVLKVNQNYNKQQKTENGYYYLTSSAAFYTPEGNTVLVFVNEDEAQTIKLKINGENMTVYTTDKEHKFEKTYDGANLKKLDVAQNSITTIVVK